MKYVGQPISRVDGIEKVTGQAKYIDDLSFENMAHAFIIRSPHPHAKILEKDIRKALKINGVLGIFSSEDIPGKNICPVVRNDWPFFAEDEVNYIGQPVAVIVAETREIAERAAENIRIKYQELPATTTIQQSLKKVVIVNKKYPDNICARYEVKKGNVKSGFAKADVIVQGTYETQYQEHAYLETQGSIAVPEPDGSITLYGSMQCPFYVQDAISTILNIPYSKVKVVQTTTGGGFGGKEDVPSQGAGICALSAMLVKRPVKLVFSREEDMISTSKRHPAKIYIKYGAKKDGRLVAAEVKYTINAGAYVTLSPIVLFRGTVHSIGPYRCDNVYAEGIAVLTHTVPCGAFRGFGSPQTIFAHESLMDKLARKLKIDPLELRLKNALRVGDKTMTGHPLTESVGLIKTIKAAADKIGYYEKVSKYRKENTGRIKRGIGVSTIYYGAGLGAIGKILDGAGAFVQLHADGSVSVSVGTTEIGQGAKTVFAQITAESLGVSIERVHVLDIDTTHVADSGPTVASRGTMMSGRAIIDACEKIKSNLLPVASRLLGITTSEYKDIVFENNKIYSKKNPVKIIELPVLARDAWKENIHLAAAGWYKASDTSWDFDAGSGSPYVVYSFATHISEVEIDTETGQIKVINSVCAHDVGKAINPACVEGQIQGGYAQGLGYALLEDMCAIDGRLNADNFTTYLVPTAKDIPDIKTVIIEEPYSEGPYSAKGIGEPPLMAAAPSITNAITFATGVEIHRLPCTPEYLFFKLRR